jgi:hypothetical protein
VYNVKDYGAKGNGVTNDRDAIQAAPNTATTNRGEIVYFPPGTYKILSGLTVDATTGANITILGTGGGATSNGGTIIVGDFNDWLLHTSNKAPIELIDRSVAYGPR